jgi:hypothetical protein
MIEDDAKLNQLHPKQHPSAALHRLMGAGKPAVGTHSRTAVYEMKPEETIPAPARCRVIKSSPGFSVTVLWDIWFVPKYQTFILKTKFKFIQ